MTREQLLIEVSRLALDVCEHVSTSVGGELQAEKAAAVMVVVGGIGRHMVETSGNGQALPTLDRVAEEVCRALEAHQQMARAMAPIVSQPDGEVVDDGK